MDEAQHVTSDSHGPRAAPADVVELASRLRLATARLARRLRQEVGSGLSPSQQSALASIERHGPVTLGDLAAVESVTPPTVTKIVGRLAADGLVERATDPRDRRVSRVAITAEGRRRLDHSRRRRDAWLAARITGLDRNEVDRLLGALGALERLAQPGPSGPEEESGRVTL